MEVKGIGQMGRPSAYFGSDKSLPLPGSLPIGEESGEFISLNDVKIGEMIKKANELMEKYSSHVEYEVHETFGDLIIKIVDDKTNNVLVEVPPKKILDLVAKLCEMVGIVIDKKV